MNTSKRKWMINVTRTFSFLLFFAISCYGQTDSLTVGPGDLLHIKVLEAPELEQSARVNDAGSLSLIIGGSVRVLGLSPHEASVAIERALERGDYLLTPHVSVTIDQTATQNVTIMGQVHSPGSYPIGTPRPILDVLALAGGLTDVADRKITIQRHATEERVSFVVSNNSDAALDKSVTVLPGDTVIVPKAEVVYILGDVNRPGGIAMVTNNSRLSVIQAISLAGGTPPNAVPSHTLLIRSNGDGTPVEIPLQLSDMEKGKKPDLQLHADDIVYVPFSYMRNMAVGASALIGSTSSAAIYKF